MEPSPAPMATIRSLARPFARRLARIGAAVLLALAATSIGAAGRQPDWLALCAKCLNPVVIQKSGIGTAHAVAIARITKDAAAAWCGNWVPGQNPAQCVREQMATKDARKTYRASADCIAGRITAVDGMTYRLAGVWTDRFARGRTKWRDPSGHIVGTDNASGGLGIAQQWEVLCPGLPARTQRPPPPHGRTPPADAFAVGQQIEARYGRGWVRGRVTRIWRHEGASGHEVAYDVRLVNGKRGIVPARMLRAAPP